MKISILCNESVLNNDSEIQNYKRMTCLNCSDSWKKMDRVRYSKRKWVLSWHLKSSVYATVINNIQDLQQRIQDGFQIIPMTPRIFQRVRQSLFTCATSNIVAQDGNFQHFFNLQETMPQRTYTHITYFFNYCSVDSTPEVSLAMHCH